MKRKTFIQGELPSKLMVNAELPGMPEKPKGVEPKISSTAMETITEAAALCAGDPKVLMAFLEELETLYPEGGEPVAIIKIAASGEKGICCNFQR